MAGVLEEVALCGNLQVVVEDQAIHALLDHQQAQIAQMQAQIAGY